MTIGDVRGEVGPAVARKVVSVLAAKGVLQRIGRGVYLVRPLRTLSRPTRPSAPFVAAVLLHGEAYHLGGPWALTQHGLTDQQNVSAIDAFVTRPRQPRSIPGARIRFHVLPRRWMDHGVTEVVIEGLPVRLTDLERTLLDLLDHPRIAGGLRRAVEVVSKGLGRASLSRLADHAVQGSRTATCQRLGSILERRGAPPGVLRKLDARVSGSRSMISLVPGQRVGRFNRRWKVVENDDGLVSASAAR